MFGWQGKALRINLSNGLVRTEVIDEALLADYVGGCALAKQIARLEDISAQNNKLILASGALTGTAVPTAAFCGLASYDQIREDVTCCSLLYHFGPELKACGYDVLIIEGKASKWSYLFITEDKVEIVPIEPELSPLETERVIRGKFKKWYSNDIRTLCIGKAALTPSALMGLVTDGLLVNRSGRFGQIFAEKRLKAIALRGTEEIKLAKPSQLQQLITDMLDSFREKKQTFFEVIHAKFAKIDLPLLWEIHHHGIEKRACFACPIACLHTRKNKFLPNFTVIFCFARLLGIDRQEDAERLYNLCIDLGIDPVALSLAARCLLELEVAGKIAKSPLRLGNTAGLMQLLKDKKAIIHKGNVGLAKEYGLEAECKNLLNIINKQWEQIFSNIENFSEKRQVLNALGLCDYALLIFPYADLIKAFSLATGKELNKTFLLAGNRA